MDIFRVNVYKYNINKCYGKQFTGVIDVWKAFELGHDRGRFCLYLVVHAAERHDSKIRH